MDIVEKAITNSNLKIMEALYKSHLQKTSMDDLISMIPDENDEDFDDIVIRIINCKPNPWDFVIDFLNSSQEKKYIVGRKFFIILVNQILEFVNRETPLPFSLNYRSKIKFINYISKYNDFVEILFEKVPKNKLIFLIYRYEIDNLNNEEMYDLVLANMKIYEYLTKPSKEFILQKQIGLRKAYLNLNQFNVILLSMLVGLLLFLMVLIIICFLKEY